MGHLLKQQPNGLFCIFSTIIDAFLVWDATEDEIIDYCIKKAAELEESKTREWIEDTKKGKCDSHPMYQTFEECIEAMKIRRPETYEDYMKGRKK